MEPSTKISRFNDLDSAISLAPMRLGNEGDCRKSFREWQRTFNFESSVDVQIVSQVCPQTTRFVRPGEVLFVGANFKIIV
jgi:hypothetical protein